jgi:hypothetical protein
MDQDNARGDSIPVYSIHSPRALCHVHIAPIVGAGADYDATARAAWDCALRNARLIAAAPMMAGALAQILDMEDPQYMRETARAALGAARGQP